MSNADDRQEVTPSLSEVEVLMSAYVVGIFANGCEMGTGRRVRVWVPPDGNAELAAKKQFYYDVAGCHNCKGPFSYAEVFDISSTTPPRKI